MALHTPYGFAKLCGKHTSGVANYITRGKLIKSGDYIDDSIPCNRAYLDKWKIDESTVVKIKKEPVQKPIKTKRPKPVKTKRELVFSAPVFPEHKPKVSKFKYEEPTEESTSIYNLDQQKKEIDIAVKEAHLRKLNLEEAKLRGLSIPTDLVTGLFVGMGRQFQASYNNGSVQFLTDFCHKAKVSPEIKAEFKMKLTKLINDSHQSAIIEMKKLIKNIIENNSIVNDSAQDDE